ncbi:RKD-RWP domain containing protein [Senna tora]|uniref:RKD-RWP domain containing protein n=1 Tax=Senna tora TaxID=362788 RepID=A0A834U119_9FABA|nr:RKD-RWP domain containing protein [Senna tora]
MADPQSIVPYHDPYDIPLPQNILNFGNEHNPTLADLSNDPYTSSIPPPNHPIFMQGSGTDNAPYSSPMIQDAAVHNFLHQGANFEPGPSSSQSQFHGESHPGQQHMGSQNFTESVQLSYWPEPPVPFICSCCQVLREIVHTNGIVFTKLEIHGRLGMICHAIQQKNINAASSGDNQIQMFDFCSRSIVEVKTFLMQYCLEQNAAGYFVLQDPFSPFYEALCIGMDWTEDIKDELVDMNLDNSGGISDEAEDMDRTLRTCLALQRERAGKMKLSDFSDYFHLPIEDAAKEVNLCPTVVKKICRKEGLARWPHRKIKSIVKKINILRGTLNSDDARSRAQTEAEINRLVQEMIQHCGGIAPTSLNFDTYS